MSTLTRGERFKDARTVHNRHGKQTMDEVQKDTGVTKSLISNLENDEKDRNVSYIDIAKLAKHYGVTTDWLCCISEDHHPLPCATDELGLSEKAVENIHNLKEHHRGLYYPRVWFDLYEILSLLCESDKLVDLLERIAKAKYYANPTPVSYDDLKWHLEKAIDNISDSEIGKLLPYTPVLNAYMGDSPLHNKDSVLTYTTSAREILGEIIGDILKDAKQGDIENGKHPKNGR